MSGGKQQLRGVDARRASSVPLPLAAIPRCTYRVQLHAEFGFADVMAVVPYLAALGVSHVYCSPYLRARPGSRHGYDVVDHRMLNPELGSREDFERMVDALAREGMGHLCDIVPNHMAVMGADNAWWMDVLENGASSPFAEYFDIDWTRRDDDLAGKVLVPVLGDAYGSVLERGELALEFDAGAGRFAVRYFEHRFPLDPRSYADILLRAIGLLRAAGAPPDVAALEAVAYTLKALPPHDETAPARVAARLRVAGEQKRRLATLAASEPVRDAIAGALSQVNGTPADAASFDALHALLEAQAFRLAHWRVASDEINYRRFFDVNELAALRMESAAVFDATHAFILALAGAGIVGGLRIDHPDGLFDPARYFAQLQQGYREHAAHHAAMRDAAHGIYVVIEKIAAPHEHVPQTWPVHGTTGYRFANVVNGLFVDGRAKARLDRIWRAFAGDEAQPYEAACYEGRRAIMEGPLASELRVLTLRALRLARADRRTRDFTFNALREGIKEIVARFPVYRTYVDADGASPQDRRYIDWAVAHAHARSRVSDERVFDFLHRALLGEGLEQASDQPDARHRRFAMQFQQFTAPVAAKGVEDTALYRFNRLVSLNEVGGDPSQFGLGVPAFHGASADRAAHWPHTLLATSTHDNKRSEDVRARIDVISEVPAAWRSMIRRWSRMNDGHRQLVDDAPAPSRNDEYLLYQTLAGSFPHDDGATGDLAAYRARIDGYMRKAAREAKVHTSWLAPHAAYEAALAHFVAALLGEPGEHRFLPDLRRECATFAWFGMLNSVSMTVLKMGSPGVPDLYQGNELLDYSLVDPDNRRAVDYAARRACLASLATIEQAPAGTRGARLRALFTAPFDGRAKMFVIVRALALRKRQPALFAYGNYRAIKASGAQAGHLVAFVRSHARQTLVVAAGRRFASLRTGVGTLPLADAWTDTTLDLSMLADGTTLTDALTGAAVPANAAVPVATLFADFPGALLHVGIE